MSLPAWIVDGLNLCKALKALGYDFLPLPINHLGDSGT